MRILKIFLYVTLIISLSWSALFFMGPYLIKWTVEKYTDGQIIVSDASLTPKFDLNIGRVSYNIKKTERSEPIIGFSRGLSVSWSILNSAPFLNLTSGPTVLKDFGELKAIEIGTANFSDFDYDELMFFSNIFGLELNSDISIETLYLSSSLKDNLSKLIGLSFELKNLKSDKIGELSVDNVSGRLKSLDLTLPISTQQVVISLDAQDISQEQFYITVSDLGGDVNFYNGDMTFDLTANQLGVAKVPLQMKSLNLDGRYFLVQEISADR